MTNDAALTIHPAAAAPTRTTEIHVTDDELVVSGLNLAGPTRLMLHAGRRSLRVADVTAAGSLTVEQCHDESCACHTTEAAAPQP
ncbi:hypothetical protein [Streptomyces violarus]|uniref:hypothetical protein n=1 Tax=Streptomyces violarus TaxID=67380 RepID=UPI0021BFC3B6|nr:hypothetical protein [Streptomyces violarus]MCT9142929.1 hypothetical protein [Streptomyces violarus]